MSKKNDEIIDALLLMYTENKNSVRHHESERASVVGTFMVTVAAIIGLITFDQKITFNDLFLTVFLFFLGVFGIVFSAKQWERADLHNTRAALMGEKISELYTDGLISKIRNTADADHKVGFPVLTKIKLHTFWIALYCFIAFLGLILTLMAIFVPVH